MELTLKLTDTVLFYTQERNQLSLKSSLEDIRLVATQPTIFYLQAAEPN